MRYVAKEQDDVPHCAPAVAALKSWLLEVLVWFVDVLDVLPPSARAHPWVRNCIAAAKANISRDLRHSVRHFTGILITLGCAEMDFAEKRRRDRSYPGHTARGLRLAKRSSCVRPLRRILAGMNEGPLRQRAAKLAAAIDNLDLHLARMLKRMRLVWRLIRPCALILATPVASRIASGTARAPAHADTS